MSLVPSNKQSIPHGKCRSMVRCKVVEIEHTPGKGGVDMSHDLSFKVLFCFKLMESKILPETAGFWVDAGGEDLYLLFSVASWSPGVMTGSDGYSSLRQRRDTHDTKRFKG